MRHRGKINRHEKVAQLLLSGKPVTPEQIHNHFHGTDQYRLMYRLATNMYNIRMDGGIIKVVKSGRKIVSYQLVNPNEFDARGRYVGVVAKITQGQLEVA